jgi:hypothetical protein
LLYAVLSILQVSEAIRISVPFGIMIVLLIVIHVRSILARILTRIKLPRKITNEISFSVDKEKLSDVSLYALKNFALYGIIPTSIYVLIRFSELFVGSNLVVILCLLLTFIELLGTLFLLVITPIMDDFTANFANQTPRYQKSQLSEYNEKTLRYLLKFMTCFGIAALIIAIAGALDWSGAFGGDSVDGGQITKIMPLFPFAALLFWLLPWLKILVPVLIILTMTLAKKLMQTQRRILELTQVLRKHLPLKEQAMFRLALDREIGGALGLVLVILLILPISLVITWKSSDTT